MTLLTRLALPLLFAAAGSVHATEVPIGDFFKDPEFKSVSLSPSGEYITVSVPQGDRTVLAAFRVSDMKLIGRWDYGEKKHIDAVTWVNDDRFFMFVSRKLGRFDFHVGTPDVYASNVDGTKRIDIPNGGTYSIRAITPEDPSTIIVQRASGLGDTVLSKLNVYNAQVRTIATVPIFNANFVVSAEGEPMYAHGSQKDQVEVTMRRDGDRWTTIHTTNIKGSERRPMRMAADGRRVVFEVSDAGETPRVVLVDPETNESEPLSHNPNVETGTYLSSSDRRELLAIRYSDGIPAYDFIDKKHPESMTYAGLINAFPDLAVSFAGISWDGKKVLVYAYSDVDPGSYYLFDRETGKAKFLLASMEWIKPEQMSEMRPIVVTARDGTKLHGYITIPRFSNGKDLPLVLNPHGGPHGDARDGWGFNPEVQFLANRGFAVLQVNFRGSGGYGTAFERKGYKNWGTTMIDDMTDAVDWAIREGIADKDRVCTYGASYGGYAALQTVVREPAKYKCTIGYVGVYDIPLMFKDGDIPQTDWGRNYLRLIHPESLAEQQRQSPAHNIDRITIPVMLVHGKKDERVPMSQYDRLHDGLVKAGRRPEMVVLEDKEGHGFYDFQNQVDLYTKMEAFLDKHIGSGAAPASP